MDDDAIERLKALGRKSLSRRFRAGEVLWTAGSPIQHMLIVVSGQVRVIREDTGRPHVVHTEGPGGTLGEVPFFSGGVAPATAIATVPTKCVVLTREAIECAIAEDPTIAWVLLGRLAARVRELVERLDRVTVQNAATRLAGLLLAHAGRGTSTDGVVTLGMTQSALAAELGTVREVVVRALRALREDGVIESAGPGRIRILRIAQLRRAANQHG